MGREVEATDEFAIHAATAGGPGSGACRQERGLREASGHNRRPCQGDDPGICSFEWEKLEEIFSRSDFISINCNQCLENTGFVNEDLLCRMKKTASLINASRGGLINEADLAAALNEERIAGAALDVVSKEPIEQENPLLHAKNVIITPHIAWSTLDARRRLMDETIKNIKGFMAGKPQNVVN